MATTFLALVVQRCGQGRLLELPSGIGGKVIIVIDWRLVRKGCPYCDTKLQYHGVTVWCIGCGFGCNWEDWPNKKHKVLADAGRSAQWLDGATR